MPWIETKSGVFLDVGKITKVYGKYTHFDGKIRFYANINEYSDYPDDDSLIYEKDFPIIKNIVTGQHPPVISPL